MIGKLKLIQLNDKVAYYSVTLFDDNDKLISENGSMFEDFRESHKYVCIKKLTYVIDWINQIGDEGATEDWFRQENDAHALPPPTGIVLRKQQGLVSFLDFDSIEVVGFDLRLYCLRLNNNVVILSNGGIKTTNQAQDCPNVSRHFRQANILSKKITDAIVNNEIEVSKDDILYNDDFEIIF